MFIKITPHELTEIVRLHASGMTNTDIGRAVHYDRRLVGYHLKKRGLRPNRSLRFLTQYNGFFQEIDTVDKAYVLGFIYADGCVDEKTLEITIQWRDVAVLEHIKACVGYQGDIGDWVNHDTDRHYARIRPHSTVMIGDLRRHGVTRRKSLTLQWPGKVPQHLLWSFLLGYFDGDGSVAIYRVQRKNPSGRYGKKIRKPVVAVVGSWPFCRQLKAFLLQGNIKSSISPHGKRKRVALVRTASFHRSAAWLHQMYQGARFFLTRKHQIASQIMDYQPRKASHY